MSSERHTWTTGVEDIGNKTHDHVRIPSQPGRSSNLCASSLNTMRLAGHRFQNCHGGLGRERSLVEYKRLFEAAGLRATNVITTKTPMTILEAVAG